jgi:plasmid stabilization system protein ParE
VTFTEGAEREMQLARDQIFARSGVVREAQFRYALAFALRTIAEFPRQRPLIDPEHRTRYVADFPWRLIYRIDAAGPRIVALEHESDRPGTWKTRC